METIILKDIIYLNIQSIMTEFTINISNEGQYLSLCIPNLMSGFSYKYEVYGDCNFYLLGSFEFNSDCKPCINFKINDNKLFFVKLYRSFGGKLETFHKFFNVNKYNVKKNINMSIQDREKIELFDSINLSENIETFNDAINSVMNDINESNLDDDDDNDDENENENENDDENENENDDENENENEND